MWADMFKRWMDLAFWWLPRDEHRPPPQARERHGASAAGVAEHEAARERVDPERVVEPAPAEPEPAKSEPAKSEPEQAEAAPAEPDDLTVIKGIGEAMQQRLRGLGIATFRDLAAADAAELTGRLQAIPVVVSAARVAAWIEAARSRA